MEQTEQTTVTHASSRHERGADGLNQGLKEWHRRVIIWAVCALPMLLIGLSTGWTFTFFLVPEDGNIQYALTFSASVAALAYVINSQNGVVGKKLKCVSQVMLVSAWIPLSAYNLYSWNNDLDTLYALRSNAPTSLLIDTEQQVKPGEFFVYTNLLHGNNVALKLDDGSVSIETEDLPMRERSLLASRTHTWVKQRIATLRAAGVSTSADRTSDQLIRYIK